MHLPCFDLLRLVTDGMIQMKMLHEGLRLFIDAEGHRSENKMLEFPLPLPADKRAEGGRDKPDTFALKIRLVQNLNALLASGLIGIPNGNLPVDNPYDIKAAATWDSLNQMTIEYQIPLKYLSISNLKPLISIGLYLPGSNAMNDDFMPPPRGPGAPGPGPGGDGMGMGGPPPGGGDMDGPPTGMGQFRDANREFKTWMKIKLAEGP